MGKKKNIPHTPAEKIVFKRNAQQIPEFYQYEQVDFDATIAEILKADIEAELDRLAKLNPEIKPYVADCKKKMKSAVNNPTFDNIKSFNEVINKINTAIHKRNLLTPLFYMGMGLSLSLLFCAIVMSMHPHLVACGVIFSIVALGGAVTCALLIPANNQVVKKNFFQKCRGFSRSLKTKAEPKTQPMSSQDNDEPAEGFLI